MYFQLEVISTDPLKRKFSLANPSHPERGQVGNLDMAFFNGPVRVGDLFRVKVDRWEPVSVEASPVARPRFDANEETEPNGPEYAGHIPAELREAVNAR